MLTYKVISKTVILRALCLKYFVISEPILIPLGDLCTYFYPIHLSTITKSFLKNLHFILQCYYSQCLQIRVTYFQ